MILDFKDFVALWCENKRVGTRDLDNAVEGEWPGQELEESADGALCRHHGVHKRHQTLVKAHLLAFVQAVVQAPKEPAAQEHVQQRQRRSMRHNRDKHDDPRPRVCVQNQ